MVKIRLHINEIENRKVIQNINETESWLFENINKTAESLEWPRKKKT